MTITKKSRKQQSRRKTFVSKRDENKAISALQKLEAASAGLNFKHNESKKLINDAADILRSFKTHTQNAGRKRKTNRNKNRSNKTKKNKK